MKSFAKVCLILVTAVTLAAYTAHAQADSSTTSTNKPATETPKPKPRNPRFTGKVTSVDSDAKTITIATPNGTTHVLHITSDTKFKKDGEPAVMADATVGQKVRGAYRKDDAGEWTARTVDIGEVKPKTAPPASTPPASAPPADANK